MKSTAHPESTSDLVSDYGRRYTRFSDACRGSCKIATLSTGVPQQDATLSSQDPNAPDGNEVQEVCSKA